MNGTITDITDKKIIVETEDGAEHTYLPKRVKYDDPDIGDNVTIKKGSDGVEITKAESTKANPSMFKKKQTKEKPENDKEEYDEEDAGYDNEGRYDEEDSGSYGDEEYDEDGYDNTDHHGYPSGGRDDGLAGFVFAIMSFFGGLIPAIIGLVLSKKVKSRTDDDKFANAGYTISKIQLIITVILLVLMIVFGSSMLALVNNLKQKTITGVSGTGTQTTHTTSSTYDDSDSGDSGNSDMEYYLNTDPSSDDNTTNLDK